MSPLVAALIALIATGPIVYLVGLQQNRRKRFEDRRDEIIAELSGYMFQVQDNYFHWFTFTPGPEGTPEEEIVERHAEKGRVAGEQERFDSVLLLNEAWFDPETASRVEDFITTVRDITWSRDPDLKNIRFYLTPEGQALARRAKDELPRSRALANARFSAILYPAWYQTPLRFLERLPIQNRKPDDATNRQDDTL